MFPSRLVVLLYSTFAAASGDTCSAGGLCLRDLEKPQGEDVDLLQVGQKSVDTKKTKKQKCVGDAQHPEAWNKSLRNTAFVVGGMGKYGKLPGLRKCLALAETIGRIGGWQGRVYVMTDELPSKSVRESAKKAFSNIHFRKIEPIRDGVDFRLWSAGGGGGYLKTQIFDLPDVPEDILIWHDCDKMIAQPDCINQIFSEASLEFGPEAQVLLGALPSPLPCPVPGQKPGSLVNGTYCEIDHCRKGHDRFADRCGDGVHVGVFAAHRVWSKEIIEEWKRRQQLEPNVYDRYTFYDAWKDMGALVGTLPAAFHDHMWKKDVVECVNHMSGPRVWDTNNYGGLEPFLASMCLQSMSFDDIFEVYSNNLKWQKNHDVVLDPRYGGGGA